MNHFEISLLLVLLIFCVHDVVVAKPSYNFSLPLSVNTLRYRQELNSQYHIQNGIDFVKKQKLKSASLNTNVAKNVILFLGDGMSVPTLAATRVYIGGEEKSLSFEEFPYVAMSKTYCVDKQVADSACTATAYLSGVKNNYGTIGVTSKVTRKNCNTGREKLFHTESIAKWALNAGKSIGLVTTTRGVYAHTAERDWESNSEVRRDSCDDNLVDDIAEQLVRGPVGKHLKVIFGGGRTNFFNETEKDEQGNAGRRTDGKNLITEWLNNKSDNEIRSYVWNKKGLLAIRPSLNQSVLGLFAPSHLDFNYKVDGISDTMPTLSEMTVKAIELLSVNPNGFFLFVEGGRIDMALHDNQAHIALEEVAEFSRAINLATHLLSTNDTLFVATADHSHTLTLSGYPERGSNIFGIGARSDLDAIPYLKLSFANGPGFRLDNHTDGHRLDPSISASVLNDFTYSSPSTLPLDVETHGGDDVVVFANGPYSHLFSGTIEQHTIPYFMAYAACIGNGITHCNVLNGYDVL